MMSLHIAKLRKDEIYINDFVMRKNPNELLKQGIAKEVIENLKYLAKLNNIKYISGYAMNEKVFNIFKTYGFQEDVRKEYGNDHLMKMAQITRCQYPFYIEII